MNITDFLWKYIVGPIIADAQNTSSVTRNGVEAFTGYNPVNTVLWGILASVIVYGLHKLVRKYEIELNTRKVIYSLPFILLGGVLRFIEDTTIIGYPESVLLITPIIYVLILGIYILAFYLSRKLSERLETSQNKIMLIEGVSVLILPVLLVFNYFLSKSVRLDLVLAVLIVPLVILGLYKYAVKDSKLDESSYLLILFSQLFGGTASMIAVTQGYDQKQLITQAFTSIFGPSGILIAKIGLSALVIYALIDNEDREIEALAVFVLTVVGLGTGFRVFLRMLAGI